ncbi:hypothetical protein GCM10009733_072910 [Nonomuraea maheshkhaliensis]|uniref:Uncharacterized protein n=1 Tax=Nonomuraea maheshkhaliensis TaxID=419590 RepID=A0ABN2G405_9ACTN
MIVSGASTHVPKPRPGTENRGPPPAAAVVREVGDDGDVAGRWGSGEDADAVPGGVPEASAVTAAVTRTGIFAFTFGLSMREWIVGFEYICRPADKIGQGR